MLIGGRKFYDQSISNQVQTYDKIRKVSMIKYYQLVDNGLSNQKELDADLKAIQQIEIYGIQITNTHNFKKEKRNNFEIQSRNSKGFLHKIHSRYIRHLYKWLNTTKKF